MLIPLLWVSRIDNTFELFMFNETPTTKIRLIWMVMMVIMIMFWRSCINNRIKSRFFLQYRVLRSWRINNFFFFLTRWFAWTRLLGMFEVLPKHIYIIIYPGLSLFKNKLTSAIQHILFQFSKEWCFENKEQHSFL